jgi:GNAT superfamily N-acetyltransferase
VRVLLDECLPKRLKRELVGHEARTAPEMGWASKRNGELLALAVGHFEIFLTADRNLSYQQDLSAFDMAIVVLVARSNRLDDLRPLVRRLLEVLSRRRASRRDLGAGLMETSSVQIGAFEIRRAEPSDVNEIALAHRDSIQSIGPAFYSPEIVEYWQEAITGELYRKAMDAGEVFFIAVGEAEGCGAVLGFASDYRTEAQKHGTSVYVRRGAARRGVGSALLARAEAHAASNGATSIEIEASLAGVEFYKANGFIEVGRGETRLTTGRSMECVFMWRDLSAVTPCTPHGERHLLVAIAMAIQG